MVYGGKAGLELDGVKFKIQVGASGINSIANDISIFAAEYGGAAAAVWGRGAFVSGDIMYVTVVEVHGVDVDVCF